MGTGTRIKDRRTQLKLSQSDLAQKLTPPVTQAAVWGWEKGTKMCKRLDDVAEALGVSVKWLKTGIEDVPPPLNVPSAQKPNTPVDDFSTFMALWDRASVPTKKRIRAIVNIDEEQAEFTR